MRDDELSDREWREDGQLAHHENDVAPRQDGLPAETASLSEGSRVHGFENRIARVGVAEAADTDSVTRRLPELAPVNDAHDAAAHHQDEPDGRRIRRHGVEHHLRVVALVDGEVVGKEVAEEELKRHVDSKLRIQYSKKMAFCQGKME